MIAAILRWFREEARLLSAHSWDREDMRVSPPAPEFAPLTREDPRCAETLARLAECRERMRRVKMGVLDGRPVTCSASTDVAATMCRARAVAVGPVRAVPARKGWR